MSIGFKTNQSNSHINRHNYDLEKKTSVEARVRISKIIFLAEVAILRSSILEIDPLCGLVGNQDKVGAICFFVVPDLEADILLAN